MQPPAGPVDHRGTQDRVRETGLAHQPLRLHLRPPVAVQPGVGGGDRRQVDEALGPAPPGEGHHVARALDVDALDESGRVRQHGGRGMHDRAHAGAVLAQGLGAGEIAADDFHGERGLQVDGIVGEDEAAHPERRFDQPAQQRLTDIAGRPGDENHVRSRRAGVGHGALGFPRYPIERPRGAARVGELGGRTSGRDGQDATPRRLLPTLTGAAVWDRVRRAHGGFGRAGRLSTARHRSEPRRSGQAARSTTAARSTSGGEPGLAAW